MGQPWVPLYICLTISFKIVYTDFSIFLEDFYDHSAAINDTCHVSHDLRAIAVCYFFILCGVFLFPLLTLECIDRRIEML